VAFIPDPLLVNMEEKVGSGDTVYIVFLHLHKACLAVGVMDVIGGVYVPPVMPIAHKIVDEVYRHITGKKYRCGRKAALLTDNRLTDRTGEHLTRVPSRTVKRKVTPTGSTTIFPWVAFDTTHSPSSYKALAYFMQSSMEPFFTMFQFSGDKQ